MVERWGRRTLYRGVEMRSRLEASFAEWLDQGALPWEYEPMVYAGRAGQWLPDFMVDDPSGISILVDVKPPPTGIDGQMWYEHMETRGRMEAVFESVSGVLLADLWRDGDVEWCGWVCGQPGEWTRVWASQGPEGFLFSELPAVLTVDFFADLFFEEARSAGIDLPPFQGVR
jgi:hypothetical protein